MMWALSKTVMAVGALLIFMLLLSYHSGLEKSLSKKASGYEARRVAGLIDYCALQEYCKIKYLAPKKISGKNYWVNITADQVIISLEDGGVSQRSHIFQVSNDSSYPGGYEVIIEHNFSSLVVF